MHKQAPIGFFDSGYGGLTVIKDVIKLLPEYDYLYLGDNARAPYGTKSAALVYQYTWECVQVLFKQGCELVILACNTASAKALRKIQQNDLVNYPGKRVLGVIRPSAEVIGDYSESNHIVVLGTQGTIASNTYVDEFDFFSPQTKVFQYACTQWVDLVENQTYTTEKGNSIIKKDIETVLEKYPKADVILLGCTHYPVLQPVMEEFLPPSIKIVTQGALVAESLKLYLERHNWLKNKITSGGNALFLTTGDPDTFEEHASQILGINIDVEQIRIDEWL